MKRWWLVMALMLSIGVNLGILASRLVPAKAAPAADGNLTDAGNATDVPGPDPRNRPRDRPDRPVPPVLHRMADELGLDGEGREQFIALQRRFLEKTVRARQQVQRSQGRLRHELLAAEPRRGVVEESLERMAAARAELEKAFAENVLDTRELLQPEQSRRFLHMIGRLRQSREQFQQRLQQRPQGPRPWQRPQGPRRQPPGPPEGERPEG